MAGVRNGWSLPVAGRRKECGALKAVGMWSMAVFSLWAGPVTEWDKTYDYEYYDNARELISVSDGGFALVSEIMTENYNLCGLLTRLDADGDTLWSVRYDSLGELFSTVKETPDLGYILGGKAVSSVVDFVLCKVDAQGAVQWIRTYDAGAEDAIADIALAADGGYVAVGTTKRATADENLAALKVDANGDSVWAKEYYASQRSQGRAVEALPEGGFILAGFLQGVKRDAWFLQIDNEGNEVWSRTHNPGDALCEINDVTATADGGFAAAGFFASGGIWGSADRFWVLCADADGDTLWTSFFDGSSSEQALRIRQTDDSGFVALGQTDSYGAGEEDLWLIRLDAAGDSLWSLLVGSERRDPAAGLAVADSGWVIAGSSWLNSNERDLRILKITETASSSSTNLTANFTASNSSGPSPFIVGFTDMSQGNPVSWQWDCDGDGNIDATDQNPVHTYSSTGTYSVTCIVSNGTDTDTLTQTDLIIVTAPASDACTWTSFGREVMWGEPNQHGIKSLAVDGDNTLICGTLGGVAEFDGHRWVGYQASDNAHWPQIEAVAVDQEGARWFSGPAGTWSFAGNDALDTADWTTHDLDIGDGQTILATGNGDVWVGGTQGLAHYDGVSWTVYSADQLGLAAANIQHIAQSPDGAIWVATYEGAAMFDGAGWTGLTTENGMSDQQLTRVAIDSGGAVWFARYYGGLIRYANGTFADVEARQGDLFYAQYVKAIACAPDGALWVRTDQGVYRHDGDQWGGFDVDDGLLSLHTECRDLLFDSFGALWTGSAEGVSRYGPNPALTADFACDQIEGAAPLSVRFEDSSSGEILEWLWDFGDGHTSTEADPVHVYKSEGVYTVRLTVFNDRFSDSRTRGGLIVVQSESSTEPGDLAILGTNMDGDSLLDKRDTLRIFFSEPLANASPCSFVDIVEDTTNNRFTSYGCLEEYAWFESDTVLAIAFAYYESMGKDTGTIGVALSGFENASGDNLPADTVWLRWDETVNAITADAKVGRFQLSQLRNPVHGSVAIDLRLPQPHRVTMALVTLSGRRISQRYERALPAGRHRIRWDLSAVAPGHYLCLIHAGAYRARRRLIIAR